MPSSQSAETHAAPAKEGWLIRLLEGKLGLLLVGALLTAFTSVALPWGLNQYDQQRQAQQHALDAETQAAEDARKDRQAQVQALTQKIDDPMLQLLAATELLIQLHGRQATAAEVYGVWNKYWGAYQDYFVFAEGNEVPQDRITVSGPQAEYLDAHPVLWTYFTTVIGPEFDRIHACLVAAHRYYDAARAAPNSGADSNFRSCLIHGAASSSFWTQPTGDEAALDAWTRFKTCVGTFLIQLHYGLEWREQLVDEATVEPAPAGDRKISQCPPGYTGDQWCRQMRYNRDVYQQMTGDCGPLAPDDVQSLDVADVK